MPASNSAQEDSRQSKATTRKTSASSTSKANTTRAKAAPSQADSQPTVTIPSTGETMSQDTEKPVAATTSSKSGSKSQSAIELRPMGSLDRPVMPSEIEVAETISVAGIRPIAASHLELCGSFLNGRPIEASHLVVEEMLPGDRPIFASTFKEMGGELLPGHRPVMVSNPNLMKASMLPGNRPIASNQIDDPEALMGYID